MPDHATAAAIAERLALATDGIVSYPRLLGAGVTRWNVSCLVDDRHLHRVVHGVYLCGLPRLTQRGLWRSATLVAGPAGGLTARSTFELCRAVPEQHGIATITTTRRSIPKRILTGIPMERGGAGLIKVVPVTVGAPLHEVSGLRSAQVPRALVDFAAVSGTKAFEQLWRSAEFRGLLSLDAIERELDRARRPGGAKVRAQVESRRILTGPDTRLRSPGELDILHLIADAGLEMPEENVPVVVDGAQYFLDFVWARYGWALELDTPDHLTPEAVARDQARDRQLLLAGLRVSHYLEAAAKSNPDAFIAWLRRALDALRRQVA